MQGWNFSHAWFPWNSQRCSQGGLRKVTKEQNLEANWSAAKQRLWGPSDDVYPRTFATWMPFLWITWSFRRLPGEFFLGVGKALWKEQVVQKKGGFEACRFFGWKIVVSVFIWGNFPLNHDYGRRGIQIHILKIFGESKCIGLSFALAKKSTWTETWDFPPHVKQRRQKNTRRTMTTTTTTTTNSSHSAFQPSNF